METEVIKTVLSQGAWACLFVWLLLDSRKDSKAREDRYINTIDKLTDKISIVEDIKEDVEEIKNKIGV